MVSSAARHHKPYDGRGKGPSLQESTDISRLITGHAINNAPDSGRSTLHAYEVALKTTRDRCQKQADQLRVLDDETRRLLADKTSLHAEIERLRESGGRQRDKASHLNREISVRHQECSNLREQVTLLSRQVHTARRRLEAAGLDAADLSPASIEQANRGSDEVHVQVPVVPPEESPAAADHIDSMTEEEIERRLLELHKSGRQTLTDSFQDMVVGLKRVAATEEEYTGSTLDHELRQVAQELRERNGVLRESVGQLLRLRERGGVVTAAADGSLPSLHEIPLTTSPGPGAAPTPAARDDSTGAPPALWPAERVCPICGALFWPASAEAEFVDHVYGHVVDMSAEDGLSEAAMPETLVGR